MGHKLETLLPGSSLLHWSTHLALKSAPLFKSGIPNGLSLRKIAYLINQSLNH